ncbi:MAG: ABC transporter ATP-binding protein [Pseudomonadota bacterium]
MTTGKTLLQVENLEVSYTAPRRFLRAAAAPVQAVAGIDLRLEEGEILGVIGESGCGKTTLARTLLGLQRESAGRILLDDHEVSGLDPRVARLRRRAIQYVHQDAAAALDPWWSIGSALAEGLDIHRLGDRKQRHAKVRATLEAVGLDPAVARRFPHEFSGGQLRRIALARILLLQPRLVILDEPTAGLDMSVQSRVLKLILDLRDRFGLTYLFISHDLSVIRNVCNRVAIMYLGRIVESGPTQAVFAHPKHPYPRALLGAAPRLDGVMPARAPLAGEPPSAARRPQGCAFHTRCAHAVPDCASAVPEMTPAGQPGHTVGCSRWEQIDPERGAAIPLRRRA